MTDRFDGVSVPLVGQWVLPEGMTRPGRVVALDAAARRAEVEIGGVHWKLPWSRLKPVDPPPEAPEASAGRGPGRAPRFEVDLHGKRVEEALVELDRFLDAAIVDRLETVKIVHGHGQGRLRVAVRRALADHPHMREFHFGGPAQGGLAVTMVRLASGREDDAD